MTIKQNYINGEWIDGVDLNLNINPSDLSDQVGEYTRSDQAQAEIAIAAAKAAAPAWSRLGIQQRADMLDNIGNEIIARKEELGDLLAREEGKTKFEGIGETMRAGHIFKFFAGEVLRTGGEKLPSVRPGIEADTSREAVGVIGLITPWNFPIAIPAWKIAPALAYGNTVVFKPADLVPGSAWALSEIISRAGLPEGVFNLVMGRGSSVGNTIVNSKDVNAISFTGSVATGRSIAISAVTRQAKIQLEMGGKNPLIVLDDADIDNAVMCAVQGAFYSSGQRCTASSRFIVTDGIHDQFVSAMTDAMKGLTIDDARKEGTDIGPVVDQTQLDQDESYIDIAVKAGGKIEFGGERLKREKEGYYLSPCLITDTTNDQRINREEVFGPVASVVRVKDYDEAISVANDTEFGLSAGICTKSLKHASDFKRNSEAGMVMVNLPTAGVDYHVPFGGRKGSSYGSREQGTYAKEFYTIVKTAYTLPL